jgi:hypothetical protein
MGRTDQRGKFARWQKKRFSTEVASFYVRTFFLDKLSWAKLAKIGESTIARNSSGSTPAEKFSAVTRLVVWWGGAVGVRTWVLIPSCVGIVPSTLCANAGKCC